VSSSSFRSVSSSGAVKDSRARPRSPPYSGPISPNRARESFTAPELEALLNEELDTGGEAVQVLDFGPEEIEEVAILTGSGADWLDEAAAAGADAFVTGEGKQQIYHEAREAGVNVFLAGHYASETFGVRSLRDLAADWGLETTFVDAPTGL
jgi:putative NIF3 family GTP cyclohydrolase 1 type 2